MTPRHFLTAVSLIGLAAPALAQNSPGPAPAASAPKPENDGTDPTQLTTSADVSFEHLDLRNGFGSQTLAFGFTFPVGKSKQTSLKIRAPFVANDVAGNDSLGFGDASIKLTRVLSVNRKRGIVVGGELVFDTAARPELGGGKTVVKGSFIYANFLKGGAIFAPAIVQSVSIGGQDSRGDVNTTALDFYFVPRLKNRNLFMTVDPAVSYDWENNKVFGSFAVTFGQKLGNMFGGNGQIFIKPSIFIGADRGANWGAQAGFKLLNF